jgi:hypothetical protein
MGKAGEAAAIDRRGVMAKDSTSGGKTAPATFPAGSLARFWTGLMKDLFDPYRPERHYMRGPGPRWREKHAYAAGTGR